MGREEVGEWVLRKGKGMIISVLGIAWTFGEERGIPSVQIQELSV
jgi:hypothetical protein